MGGAPSGGFGGSSEVTQDDSANTISENGTINFNGYTITLADGTVLQ